VPQYQSLDNKERGKLRLNDIRRLAWLAQKQDYRWDLLVSLVRSVLDNVSTVETEHSDPLSNFL